jgi:hypothetical protein
MSLWYHLAGQDRSLYKANTHVTNVGPVRSNIRYCCATVIIDVIKRANCVPGGWHTVKFYPPTPPIPLSLSLLALACTHFPPFQTQRPLPYQNRIYAATLWTHILRILNSGIWLSLNLTWGFHIHFSTIFLFLQNFAFWSRWQIVSHTHSYKPTVTSLVPFVWRSSSTALSVCIGD